MKRSRAAPPRVLSVDLASKWSKDLGIAVLESTGGRGVSATLVPPSELKLQEPMVAEALAAALARLADHHGCGWLALDGPQAWKHPDNGLSWSRCCDREANAPAKVGQDGSQVKPRSYAGFVDFSIHVFDELDRLGWPRLSSKEPTESRLAIESFPLKAWRSLDRRPLPAKRKCRTPAQREKWRLSLADLVALPPETSHDELQAVVGGLGALWLRAGLSGQVAFLGRAPLQHEGRWREGFIVVPAKQPGATSEHFATPCFGGGSPSSRHPPPSTITAQLGILKAQSGIRTLQFCARNAHRGTIT